MKTSTLVKADPKRVAALRKAPALVRLRTLMDKVADETATPEERAEYHALTRRAREMNPNVLID